MNEKYKCLCSHENWEGAEEIVGIYLGMVNAITGKVWLSLSIILGVLWLLFPFLSLSFSYVRDFSVAE